MRIQMEKTHLYSNLARWWPVGNNGKDKIVDILLAIVSTINERTEAITDPVLKRSMFGHVKESF